MAIDWTRALMTGSSGAIADRRSLAIAERLKQEAEARDLAARQQLAAESFDRQKELFGLQQQAEESRWSRGQEASRISENRQSRQALINAGIPYGITWEPGDNRQSFRAKLAEAAGAERAAEAEREATEFSWKEEDFRINKQRADLQQQLLRLQILQAQSTNPDDAKVIDNVKTAITTLDTELEALNQKISGMMEMDLAGRPTGDYSPGVTDEDYKDAIKRRNEIIENMATMSRRLMEVIGPPSAQGSGGNAGAQGGELNPDDIPDRRVGATGGW